MMRSMLGIATSFIALLSIPQTSSSADESHRYALTSAKGLALHNVAATPAKLHGKSGIRVVLEDEHLARIKAMDGPARQRAVEAGEIPEQLAIIDGLKFGDGDIEVEIAGEPMTGVFEGARGFVGIAFRVQDDRRAYDAFYLRPTNGRADDQVRRNHSAQYISHPNWPWFRLRTESPKKYESYVDLVPGEWTRVRIEVRGEKARMFVHGVSQPTLIVNDVKSGAAERGAVALWLDLGTIAHFRNLVVRPIAASETAPPAP
jgi:hypothetical protein